jgi:hypothetical protein
VGGRRGGVGMDGEVGEEGDEGVTSRMGDVLFGEGGE